MPMQQKIELFLQVNGYGQHVSDEHLEKIKNMNNKGVTFCN